MQVDQDGEGLGHVAGEMSPRLVEGWGVVATHKLARGGLEHPRGIQDIEVEGRPYLSHRPADVRIRARGQVFEKSLDFANWLSIGVEGCIPTDEGLAEKFRANAEGVLPPAQTEAVIDAVMSLEDVGDVSTMMEQLAAQELARVSA